MTMKRIFIAGIFIFIYLPETFAFRDNSFQPYFTTVPVKRIAVDSMYEYSFAAADSAGHVLTFSTAVLPDWLRFDRERHVIRGKAERAGQYQVRITVSNGKHTTDQYFMLTVYNRQTRNIVCIGNSITNGTDRYNSYRRPLWQLLHRANYNFDMVGSWSMHHMGGAVPDPDFDTDHDGHSGWTFEHVFMPPDWDSSRGNITNWLRMYTPDIALIELGTNDVFQCRAVEDMLQDLDKLVNELRRNNEAVTIVIAEIPPLGKQWADKKLCGNEMTYDQRIRALNGQIKIFAMKSSTQKSTVMSVDQYTWLNPSEDMYDDIHPNARGEELMAKKWFDAIRSYLKKL
jgi:lysophospholipase L1-like esterase